MLQNLQKFAKFQEVQLESLVDFEKCSKTRIYLQRSALIQPKTSEILPKIGRASVRVDSLHPAERVRARGGERRPLQEANEIMN